MDQFTISPDINAALIFGDFVKVVKLLGGLLTGGIFASVVGSDATHPGLLANSGFTDVSVQLLMTMLFDSASFFLILYIISNRSI